MTRGLLIDCDDKVSAWAFAAYNKEPFLVDRAFGIIEKGQIVGAVLFSSYNTVNANLSYYGRNTLTAGIVRDLSRIALYELRLARCTVIVPQRPRFLLKKLSKFGFKYEGVQRRFYGHEDTAKNAGCRFVIFKEEIEKLAARKLEKVA